MKFSSRVAVRGATLFGSDGIRAFKSLTYNQPLILIREPGNPVDRNAVILATLWGDKVGYVGRESASTIGPMMDIGIIFLGKFLRRHPNRSTWGYARVWTEEGEEVCQTSSRSKGKRVVKKAKAARVPSTNST